MQLVRRRGGIFQQIDLAGELNHEEFVVGSGQRVIDKMDAGQALIAQLAAEVGAGLRQEAEGRRAWAAPGKTTGWSGCGRCR